jgi:aryl-alcohol dehydrogenase-like predicted oxidoreductase
VNHRTLGKTGWQVTELSLGCATHVVSWNEDEERIYYQNKVRQVEALRFPKSPGRALVAAALQFLFANPAVSCAIPGASRPQRLGQYMQAYATRLTPAEIARIDAITDPRLAPQPA